MTRHFVIVTWHRHSNSRYIDTLKPVRIGLKPGEEEKSKEELQLVKRNSSLQTPILSRIVNAAKRQVKEGFYAQLRLDPNARLFIPLHDCEFEVRQDNRVRR